VSHSDLSIAGQANVMERSSPFAMPTKKLAMWLFIVADAATFAACLLVYGFLRNGSLNWPTPFKFFPTVVNAMLMTFVLITSSFVMFLAVRAAKMGDRDGAFRWIMLAAAMGAIFALLHLREWMGLINEGVTLLKNPWGNQLFGAAFFTITGLHLTHVTVGVVVLIIIAMRHKSGKADAEDVEITGLYWHFVDLVWMFVVPLVYLLNVQK